jgi:hypothetical protein
MILPRPSISPLPSYCSIVERSPFSPPPVGLLARLAAVLRKLLR